MNTFNTVSRSDLKTVTGNNGNFTDPKSPTNNELIAERDRLSLKPGAHLSVGGSVYRVEDSNAFSEVSVPTSLPIELLITLNGEASDAEVATDVVQFRAPAAINIAEVRVSAVTAPTGSALIVDVSKSGSSIFSSLPQIDAGDTTSVGSASPAVISNGAVSDDELIAIDVTQVGSSTAGAGIKVLLKGTRA